MFRLIKSFSLIKVFIILGNVGVPITCGILFVTSQKNIYIIFFTLFMLFHSYERIWETFFTTKEHKVDKFQGDWTLAVVTVAYLLLCWFSILDFYINPNSFNVMSVSWGVLLYVSSFRLRWWGMKSLGKQWAIHAVGAQKIKKVRLIKLGPYKYVRHPIYLAVMMEVLSIPLLASSLGGIVFAAVVNIPLQYLRLIKEEQSTLRKLGESYKSYIREVDRLIPLKLLIGKK
jgi:methyltransferase